LPRAAPDVRAVVLTMGLATAAVRQLISAGAAACLTKECASQELIAAIRTVVSGKVYLSPRLTEQVVRRYVQAPSSRAAQALSARETEVLRRIARGQSTKEIAYAMRVGSKTIETYRRRIMDKLNRHSVAELTQYAMVRGLIELPESIEA
jgi:DNA-binding NarL/FixJ family response regulator